MCGGGGGGGNVADRTHFNKMVITIVFLVAIGGEILRAEVDREAEIRPQLQVPSGALL